MEIPTYVTVEEVRRVCTLLNIRDWTTLSDSAVFPEEASVILFEVNTEGMNIEFESFRRGLEVELEHGVRFKDANVTNNHPLLTGKIVLAHLKETMDYYERLEVRNWRETCSKLQWPKTRQKLSHSIGSCSLQSLTLPKWSPKN